MDFYGKQFEGQTVKLDGNSFVECSFKDVVFYYEGGPIELGGCRFETFPKFQIGGDLERGLGAMAHFYAAAGQTDRLLKEMEAFIRNPPAQGGPLTATTIN